MRRLLLINLAIAFCVSMVTVLPLCSALFRCGCTMLHGDRACNVHERFGPHCPWCEGGAKAFLPGYLVAMLVGGGGAWLSLRWRPAGFWRAMVSGVVAYHLTMVLAAWVTAKLMHYPFWLAWRVA
jgi:hypothetical protein